METIVIIGCVACLFACAAYLNRVEQKRVDRQRARIRARYDVERVFAERIEAQMREMRSREQRIEEQIRAYDWPARIGVHNAPPEWN